MKSLDRYYIILRLAVTSWQQSPDYLQLRLRRIRQHGLNVAVISYFIFNIRINQLRKKSNKTHKDSVLFLRAEIQLSEQLVLVWRSELADEKMRSFKNRWTNSVNTAATFTNLEWELYMTRLNSHFGLFFWCHLIVILTVLCNTYLYTLLCFNA